MEARKMLETLEDFSKRGMEGFSGGRSYAFSVKCYRSADECSVSDFEDVRGDHGIDAGFSPEWIRERFEDGVSPDFWQGAEEDARRDAWEDAGEVLRTIADGRLDFLSMEQEGRSGGWIVLRGLDPDALQDCARDWTSLQSMREDLRAIRARGWGARTEREDGEARLRELGEDIGLPRYIAQLDALRDLREHTSWSAWSLESMSAHSTLGIEPKDAIPAPEDLEPETDAGDAWSFEELASLVSALEEWEEFLRGAVLSFPRLVLWHCGGVYEREKAEALEVETERARVQAEEDARGALVSELMRTADALVRVLDSVREHLDEEDGDALLSYAEARDGVAEGVPCGTRVTLRRVDA